MTMWSQDNILVLSASSGKKGGGVNSVLDLLKDLLAFREKVGAAIDAQDLTENKQKLEEYQERLGEMYEALLGIAKSGVKTVRQPIGDQDKQPIMMNDNTIQELP